jgi:hypothetical protein
LGGERWEGEEEGEEEGETEEERKRECRQRQYILDLPTECSVGNTVGDSAGVSVWLSGFESLGIFIGKFV